MNMRPGKGNVGRPLSGGHDAKTITEGEDHYLVGIVPAIQSLANLTEKLHKTVATNLAVPVRGHKHFPIRPDDMTVGSFARITTGPAELLGFNFFESSGTGPAVVALLDGHGPNGSDGEIVTYLSVPAGQAIYQMATPGVAFAYGITVAFYGPPASSATLRGMVIVADR